MADAGAGTEDEKKVAAEHSGHHDDQKQIDIKSTPSFAKKKMMSKSMITSKSSLKKMTESAISTISEASSTSLGIKRQSDIERLTKGPRYQNTYRLDSKKPFKPHEVYKIMQQVVTKELGPYPTYDTNVGSKIAQTIAAEVRTSVRAMAYDRYKICVIVYYGEKKLQGFQAVFRALWDHERDGWTTYFTQTRTYFCSCTCFGIYHD